MLTLYELPHRWANWFVERGSSGPHTSCVIDLICPSTVTFPFTHAWRNVTFPTSCVSIQIMALRQAQRLVLMELLTVLGITVGIDAAHVTRGCASQSWGTPTELVFLTYIPFADHFLVFELIVYSNNNQTKKSLVFYYFYFFVFSRRSPFPSGSVE